MEYLSEILIALTGLFTSIFAIYKWRIENLNKKVALKKLERTENLMQEEKEENQYLKANLTLMDRLLDIKSFVEIYNAVTEIFQETHADRFLILIAPEKNKYVKSVSIIFEHHAAKEKVTAIARYQNVEIDDHYRELLERVEKYGPVDIFTKNLDEQSYIRGWFEKEDVKCAKIRFLFRCPVTEKYDILIYSSLASHAEREFTHADNVYIQNVYNSQIKPNLQKIVGNNENEIL